MQFSTYKKLNILKNSENKSRFFPFNKKKSKIKQPLRYKPQFTSKVVRQQQDANPDFN